MVYEGENLEFPKSQCRNEEFQIYYIDVFFIYFFIFSTYFFIFSTYPFIFSTYSFVWVSRINKFLKNFQVPKIRRAEGGGLQNMIFGV